MGAMATEFRTFQNINGYSYDADKTDTIYAEDLNDITETLVDHNEKLAGLAGYLENKAVGSFTIVDGDPATKSYSLRATGSLLDFEGAGADVVLSVWSGVNNTGVQRTYAVFEALNDQIQLLSKVQFRGAAWGDVNAEINGATGNATFRGDITVDDNTKGVILRSPDGSKWRLVVDNSGNLSTVGV